MKCSSEDLNNKFPNKKFGRASFMDRIWAFLQWLPGIAELRSPLPDSVLPPTQAWTQSCPDSSLRCLGCGQYLEAPVKQCVNGHSVCSKCRRLLKNCPTCRNHFIRTPQPVLDRLLSTTRLPCLYAAFGCPVLEVLRTRVSVGPWRDSVTWATRRRDAHSRHCSYRPSSCSLCAWETPPRLSGRGDSATGDRLLAQHMTSAHKHHALQLDKEHILYARLEFTKQTPAFLSCAITADNQVFVFVMNYDVNRRKFFVLLKHVGSLSDNKNSIKSVPLQNRNEILRNQSSKASQSATESEKCQLRFDDHEELKSHQDNNVTSDKTDSFERSGHERIFRGQQYCEYCYLVELMDGKCIQSVRLAQSALSKEDALDLAVKSGRCISVDGDLIDRLLEPGNGHFTVKMTISRIPTNVEEVTAASLEDKVT